MLFPGQLRAGERPAAAHPAARVRRHPVPERHQVGAPELGRRGAEEALPAGLPTPPAWGDLHPGAPAMGHLRPQE